MPKIIDPILTPQDLPWGHQTNRRLAALERAAGINESQVRATITNGGGGGGGVGVFATDEETKQRFVSGKAVSPANLGALDATETQVGLARMATADEAILWPTNDMPDNDLTGTIMSPARVFEQLSMFAPAVGMGRTAVFIADCNEATETGFYAANALTIAGVEYGTLNCPPRPDDVSVQYAGVVMNTSEYSYNHGAQSPVMQVLWEYAFEDGAEGEPPTGGLARIWTRVGMPQISDPTYWTPWTSDDATTAQRGQTRLATNAETVTGTDGTIATTPAGVKAAVDGAIGALPAATTTTAGIVRLAEDSETAAGTDDTIAATPSGVAAAIAAVAPPPVDPATETTAGITRYATVAEAEAGTDAATAVTPQGVKAAIDATVEPPLPAPLENLPTGGAITSAAAAWQAVVGSADVTFGPLARPLVVRVEYSGIAATTAGQAYVMIGVNAFGGLSLLPEIQQGTGTTQFAYTPFSNAGNNSALFGSKRITIPAGIATNLRMYARRNSTTGAATLNYPKIDVIPERWA